MAPDRAPRAFEEDARVDLEGDRTPGAVPPGEEPEGADALPEERRERASRHDDRGVDGREGRGGATREGAEKSESGDAHVGHGRRSGAESRPRRKRA